MPLNQLIQFCHHNYNRPERCDDCPNENCRNSCTACLDHIHQVGTHDRSYNCPNIIFCYTCKYLFRYSSEIEFLLNRYTNVFRNAQIVRLWSIGCGPATELFGLHNFKINNHLDFEIEYKGFDLNEIWTPIHNFIHPLNNFQADFFNQDFFNYLETTEERPHIVILNYLLSDILRTNREYINEFIENLCTWYSHVERTFLIINDINLGRNINESRFYYERIVKRVRELRELNVLRHEGRYHFANGQRFYFQYGQRNINNQVQLIPDPEIEEFYSPWLECRSAQLVLL
jgi:hypothetical protein